jgi:hypothetical protein
MRKRSGCRLILFFRFPFEQIVAAEREPDTIVVAANATLWEFSYNEFGTWGFGGGAGGQQVTSLPFSRFNSNMKGCLRFASLLLLSV